VSARVVCVMLIWDCRVEIWEWSFRVTGDGDGADAGPGIWVVWPEGSGGVLKPTGIEVEAVSWRGDVCADVDGEAGRLGFGGVGITSLCPGSMCVAIEGMALVTGVASEVD
jgi:hypothetical protein